MVVQTQLERCNYYNLAQCFSLENLELSLSNLPQDPYNKLFTDLNTETEIVSIS